MPLSHLCGSSGSSLRFYNRREPHETIDIPRKPRMNLTDRNQNGNDPQDDRSRLTTKNIRRPQRTAARTALAGKWYKKRAVVECMFFFWNIQEIVRLLARVFGFLRQIVAHKERSFEQLDADDGKDELEQNVDDHDDEDVFDCVD